MTPTVDAVNGAGFHGNLNVLLLVWTLGVWDRVWGGVWQEVQARRWASVSGRSGRVWEVAGRGVARQRMVGFEGGCGYGFGGDVQGLYGFGKPNKVEGEPQTQSCSQPPTLPRPHQQAPRKPLAAPQPTLGCATTRALPYLLPSITKEWGHERTHLPHPF